MNPKLPSKIFIDGGVVAETQKAKNRLGYLDGQTTNPTLIAKNLASSLGGKKLTEDAALSQYKTIVQAISQIIPQGSVSIQVFGNKDTSAEDMLLQAKDRNTWIPNASIKFPCVPAGLEAASKACMEMPINITLVFSQAQAAAVYEATKGAKYPVFLSPFVGRLDDIGENGMDVITNIIQMYSSSDKHVEVLTASIRNIDHILYAFYLKSDILTIPFGVFEEWGNQGFGFPTGAYKYEKPSLKSIPYDDSIVLGKPWREYNLQHDLTDKGLQRFWDDWMGVLR